MKKPFPPVLRALASAALAAPALSGAAVASPLVLSEDHYDEPWHTYEAPPIRYSYFELSYLLSDVGEFSDEADGWAFAASIDLTDQLRIFANLRDSELDEGGSTRAETDVVLGLGFHTELTERVDWTFDVSYLDEDERRLVDQGIGFDLGLRWRPTRLLEFGAGAIYQLYDELDGVGDDADAIGGRVEGHLWLQDNVSFFARYQTLRGEVAGTDAADRDNLEFGVRLAF